MVSCGDHCAKVSFFEQMLVSVTRHPFLLVTTFAAKSLNIRPSPVLPDIRPSVHDGPCPDDGASPDDNPHHVHVRRLETAGVQLALDLGALADFNRVKLSKQARDARAPSHLLSRRRLSC